MPTLFDGDQLSPWTTSGARWSGCDENDNPKLSATKSEPRQSPSKSLRPSSSESSRSALADLLSRYDGRVTEKTKNGAPVEVEPPLKQLMEKLKTSATPEFLDASQRVFARRQYGRQLQNPGSRREAELKEELRRTKSQHQDLQKYVKELEQKFEAATQDRNESKDIANQLQIRVKEVNQEAELLRKCVETTAQKCEDLEQMLKRTEVQRDSLAETVSEDQAALAMQQTEIVRFRSQLELEQQELINTHEQLAATAREAECLLMEKHKLQDEKRILQVQSRSFWENHRNDPGSNLKTIAELEVMVDKLTKEVKQAATELDTQKEDAFQFQSEVHALKRDIAEVELSRRELRNIIQEMNGNIRVFCRIKPSTASDEEALVFQRPNRVMLSHGSDGAEISYFTFDKVFSGSVSQSDVFDEVESLVQSALDGYKVCIFAYGQTGSGKTHTMQGNDCKTEWGIIPRALDKVLENAVVMRSKGWIWTLKASFLEVYNESVRDLLRGNSGGDAAGGPPIGHVITHHDDWGVVVTNMTDRSGFSESNCCTHDKGCKAPRCWSHKCERHFITFTLCFYTLPSWHA